MPDTLSHAPTGWECIFCLIANGGETQRTKRDAIVLQNNTMTAFVASHWWPNNPGHVLVIPNQHTENIYDFPTHLGNDLIDFTQQIAHAMKTAYRCASQPANTTNQPDTKTSGTSTNTSSPAGTTTTSTNATTKSAKPTQPTSPNEPHNYAKPSQSPTHDTQQALA